MLLCCTWKGHRDPSAGDVGARPRQSTFSRRLLAGLAPYTGLTSPRRQHDGGLRVNDRSPGSTRPASSRSPPGSSARRSCRGAPAGPAADRGADPARFSISRAPLREALRSPGPAGTGRAPAPARRPGDRADRHRRRPAVRHPAALERHAIEAPSRWPPAPDRAARRGTPWLDQMRQAERDGDELRKDDAHRAFHAAVVALAGNRQLDLALEPILLKLQRPMASTCAARRTRSARRPGSGPPRAPGRRRWSQRPRRDPDRARAPRGQRFLTTGPVTRLRRERCPRLLTEP